MSCLERALNFGITTRAIVAGTFMDSVSFLRAATRSFPTQIFPSTSSPVRWLAALVGRRQADHRPVRMGFSVRVGTRSIWPLACLSCEKLILMYLMEPCQLL